MSSLPDILHHLPVKVPVYFRDLEKYGIYKLPDMVYKIMFEAAGPSQDRLSERQRRIRKVMLDYIEEHYPDKELENFQDFTCKEAEQISKHIHGFSYGMYVKLLDKPAKPELPNGRDNQITRNSQGLVSDTER